jgi:hypothetical protein
MCATTGFSQLLSALSGDSNLVIWLIVVGCIDSWTFGVSIHGWYSPVLPHMCVPGQSCLAVSGLVS